MDIEKALDQLIKEIIEPDVEKSSIETKESFHERYRELFKQSFSRYTETMVQGFYSILRSPKFTKEQAEIFEEQFSKMELTEGMVDKMVKEQISLVELLGIDPLLFEVGYEVANSCLDADRVAEASSVFLFLSTFNPTIFQYWLGLGICSYKSGMYEEALQAYLLALELAGEEGVPILLWMADLLEDMGKKGEALKSVEEALKLAGEKKKWEQSVKLAQKKKQELEG